MKNKSLSFNTLVKTNSAFFFLIYSLYNNNSRKEKEKLLLMPVMIQTNSGIHLTVWQFHPMGLFFSSHEIFFFIIFSRLSSVLRIFSVPLNSRKETK